MGGNNEGARTVYSIIRLIKVLRVGCGVWLVNGLISVKMGVVRCAMAPKIPGFLLGQFCLEHICPRRQLPEFISLCAHEISTYPVASAIAQMQP